MVSGDSVHARIVCQNVIGMSIPSDVNNGAILPGVPSGVMNFQCTDRNINSISLAWDVPLNDGGSPISCYVITIQEIGNNMFNSQFTSQEICRSSNNFSQFNSRVFTATGLTNGNSYVFTIVARNVAGNSISVTAQCIACVTPATPGNLREDVNLRGLNALGISWNDGFNNGAIGISYTVFASFKDQNGIEQNSQVSSLSERAYFADNLFVGTEYAISVQASNMCGASPVSSAIRLIVGTIPSKPCPVFTRNV